MLVVAGQCRGQDNLIQDGSRPGGVLRRQVTGGEGLQAVTGSCLAVVDAPFLILTLPSMGCS
jgi:hypothetical protein